MIPDVRYDEENEVLRIKFTEVWTEEDIPAFFERMGKLFEGRPRRVVLGDVSEAKPQNYSKEFRKMIADESARLGFEKTAVLGANSILRMMAKILLAVLKNKLPMKAKFFNSEEEALDWLKEP